MTSPPLASPPPSTPPPAAIAPRRTMPTAALSSRLASRKGVIAPPRIILNAVEGWGKTTCAAYTKDPALIMLRGENGYDTLLSAGLVPDVPAAVIDTWENYMAELRFHANTDPLPFATLNIDSLGIAERLCHEYTCLTEYKNNWSETGFMSYQKGYETALTHWLEMLITLDKIRDKGASIVFLGHLQVRNFKNPLGPDYDRFLSDTHEKTTWAATRRWADAVFFGDFVTLVANLDAKGKKGKGVGGTERVLYTEHRDAYDAKNRYGMPSEIPIPDDPTRAWATITSHINK